MSVRAIAGRQQFTINHSEGALIVGRPLSAQEEGIAALLIEAMRQAVRVGDVEDRDSSFLSVRTRASRDSRRYEPGRVQDPERQECDAQRWARTRIARECLLDRLRASERHHPAEATDAQADDLLFGLLCSVCHRRCRAPLRQHRQEIRVIRIHHHC